MRRQFLALFTMVFAQVGCSAEGDPAIGTTSAALGGSDSHLYLRCNSTGWGVDDATRLRATSDPNVFTLDFEVTQPWMVSGSDSCTFTETPVLNGWGSWQKYYGKNGAGTLQVPGSDTLKLDGGYFSVKFPALGGYRATVNFGSQSFSIAAAGADERPLYSVIPLLFVPTDWSVSSSEVQTEAAALETGMQEVRDFYTSALTSHFDGRTIRLNPLEVVQASGPKESYGIVHNGRSIYEDGVEITDNLEHLVVDELHQRGYPTPPAQDEDGYVTLIFVKGAGGWAGGRELGAADGGWAILGDWAIDSIDGTVPEGAYWWSGRRLQLGAAAHELGHAYGLPHPDAYDGDWGATVMGWWWDDPTIGLDVWGKETLLDTKSHWFE